MSAPEDNPADDVQPTEEEWDAWLAQCPLTPEQAQKEYDQAVPVPMSEERIQEIVGFAVGRKKPERKQP